MNFWLYLGTRGRAIIHSRRCSSVTAKGEGKDWYGPYAKSDSARLAAHILVRLNATHCGTCLAMRESMVVFRAEGQVQE